MCDSTAELQGEFAWTATRGSDPHGAFVSCMDGMVCAHGRDGPAVRTNPTLPASHKSGSPGGTVETTLRRESRDDDKARSMAVQAAQAAKLAPEASLVVPMLRRSVMQLRGTLPRKEKLRSPFPEHPGHPKTHIEASEMDEWNSAPREDRELEEALECALNPPPGARGHSSTLRPLGTQGPARPLSTSRRAPRAFRCAWGARNAAPSRSKASSRAWCPQRPSKRYALASKTTKGRSAARPPRRCPRPTRTARTSRSTRPRPRCRQKRWAAVTHS